LASGLEFVGLVARAASLGGRQEPEQHRFHHGQDLGAPRFTAEPQLLLAKDSSAPKKSVFFLENTDFLGKGDSEGSMG